MMRPAQVCSRLLTALDASEGRRRRRKRNTTPDAIGLDLKRTILEATIRQDPEADEYEQWLTARCFNTGSASGPMLAMAREVLADWHLAQQSTFFRSWLEQGAPSDDATS
jgi:hypothetical protein